MDPIATYVACFLASGAGGIEPCGKPPWHALAARGYDSGLVCAVVPDASDADADRFCLLGRSCDAITVHPGGRRLYFCRAPEG